MLLDVMFVWVLCVCMMTVISYDTYNRNLRAVVVPLIHCFTKNTICGHFSRRSVSILSIIYQFLIRFLCEYCHKLNRTNKVSTKRLLVFFLPCSSANVLMVNMSLYQAGLCMFWLAFDFVCVCVCCSSRTPLCISIYLPLCHTI